MIKETFLNILERQHAYSAKKHLGSPIQMIVFKALHPPKTLIVRRRPKLSYGKLKSYESITKKVKKRMIGC